MNFIFPKRIAALLMGVVLATAGCDGDTGGGNGGGGVGPEGLHVYVNVPDALKNGGPAGFSTTVADITATVALDGAAVTPDEIRWYITDVYGLAAPPTPATPSPATGATTSFAIPDFETVREGANAWLNGLYGTAGTEHEFEYIPAPERQQLLSFGAQQVQAMSYRVTAQVRVGTRNASGSVLVSPVTISNGGNTLPLGMMVVGNTVEAETYAWTLRYLPTNAGEGAEFGAPPAGVTLSAADTRNPYVVPTVTGVYQLQNGENAPILFRISTYHGAGTLDTDKGADGVACADCHEPTDYGDYTLTQFAEWRESPHASHAGSGKTLFQLGITGALGPDYGESAIASHVVGYSKVPSARNAGFDDVMGGWTVPVPGAGNWDALPQALKYRAGVQCESCHGPLEPTDHSVVDAFGHGVIAPMASFDSGICLSCHDTREHDQGALWATSNHANLELAMEEIGSASCARCHGAEGFVKYLARQQTDTGAAAWGNMTTAEMEGLSPATVHSTSCQTCHDPHSTELRVSGDTKTVAGVFTLTDVGGGALCIICHNTRSGAVKQGTYAITSLQRLGPHHSAQGDMLAGRNAFFMPNLTATDAATVLPYLSKHARVADTCVRCHVKWVPEDIKAKYLVAASNHTFQSSKQICSECHAGDLGDSVEESITAKMNALNNRIGEIIAAKLLQPAGFDTAAGARTNPDTGAALPDPTSRTVLPASVSSITTSKDVGAVIVVLTDGSKFQVTLDKVHGVGTTTALLTIANGSVQTVAKAYFNLLYVSFDGSTGFHNPAFAAEVLDRSLAALSGVSIP